MYTFTIALHFKVIIKKLVLWVPGLGPCLRLVTLRRCGIESEDSPSEVMADGSYKSLGLKSRSWFLGAM